MRIPQNANMHDEMKFHQMLEKMNPNERANFIAFCEDLVLLEAERKKAGIKRDDEITKALYMIDMNNGFVNFGAMANPKYNALVPEQLEMIKKFRKEGELVNFILEGHEKDALIPEFIEEQEKVNTRTYYKNCINGMLNGQIQEDIRKLKNLREVVIEGVCADLCVMDFARTYARYLDEINHEAKLFVVKNAIDTFDAPGHERDEWIEIACKVMAAAGIEIVEDINHLEQRERELGLYLANGK